MNPLIFRKGVCDPHIHIFEGKAYLYATHDAPGYEDDFHMDDWQIWSSENLIDWKLESVIHPEEFYCGGLNECWALDAAYKNGKYYLYFSTGDWGVGVAVSDHPAGPFKDALGEALVDYRVHPVNVPKWDPCVFTDDDGKSYLIVGECRVPKPWDCYLIARLEEDMIHLAEPLRKIEYIGNTCPEDKPSIHKYGDRYYLTHASFVAVSDRVYGPYQHIGSSGCSIDHGSYFTFHNQTYFACGGMDNPNRYLRSSYLTPCHYRANGEIVIEQKIMEYGCGQYDASWEKIGASWYFKASRPCKKELEDGTFAVELQSGDCLFFSEIANIEQNSNVQVWASGEKDTYLTIHEETEDGTLLGSVNIGTELGYYSGRLNCEYGKKSLCLVAHGKVEFHWFSFRNGKKVSSLEPALCLVGRGASLTYDPDGSNHQVLQNMELKGAAIEGMVDGGAGGTGVLKIPYSCIGKSTVLQLSVNGKIQGKIEFPVTGKAALGKTPNCAEAAICLKEGVNRIRLYSEEYQEGRLRIDHLLVETEESCDSAYPAANGAITPVGNGCWDGVPQWETELGVFSGRIVKYLGKPGDSITISGVNGGQGGLKCIEIHYCRGEDGASRYKLWINGKEEKVLLFPPTGKFSAKTMSVCRVEALLKKGGNIISLEKTGGEDQGIYVDAIAVISSSPNN